MNNFFQINLSFKQKGTKPSTKKSCIAIKLLENELNHLYEKNGKLKTGLLQKSRRKQKSVKSIEI